MMWIYQCILPRRGCTSNYTGFTWFSTDEKSVNLMWLIEMHIFGYQIGTVNMNRCHGSQISMQGSQFFRPVNEKN